MSEETTDASGTTTKVSGTAETPSATLSQCDICKAAVEGACIGLVIGGVIVALPEEGAIAAVVAGLTAAGLAFGADEVRAWIKEAITAGINTAKDLAAFLCKKAGVCS